jgi:hypothetical protein
MRSFAQLDGEEKGRIAYRTRSIWRWWSDLASGRGRVCLRRKRRAGRCLDERASEEMRERRAHAQQTEEEGRRGAAGG